MIEEKTKSTIKFLGILLLMAPLFCIWMQPAGAAPSLSIAKTTSTSGYPTGSPGVSSNFKIEITNTGDSHLSSVVLTDLMPSGITFTGSTLTPASITMNDNGSTTVTWKIGNMNPGGSKTVYPRGTRNGRAFGSAVNYAVVTGMDPSGKTVLASKAYSVTVLKPNIRIVEAASPSSGASCAELTYSIKVFNTGEDNFSSVRFSDHLPKGLSYVAGSAAPAPNSAIIYDNGTTNLTWNDLKYLGTGDSKTITLKARITGEAFGQLTCCLRVVAKPPKNAYCVVNTTSSNVQALRSGVELTDTVSPSSGFPGTVTDFAINISNTGEAPLRLELTDTIPEGLTLISSNPAGSELGRTIDWNNLGDLSPGNSIPVRLTAKIDGQKYGTLVNRVRVTGRPPDGCNVTDEDSLELASYRSGLQVNETTNPDSGTLGCSIDFLIDITNKGGVDLSAINVQDLLPEGLMYSSASVDPTEKNVEANGTTSVVWNNILTAPLAPNASVSVHLIAIIDGSHSGSLQNKISARGLTPSGFSVTAEDKKSVTALMSAIHLAETAIPDSGCPGTLVDLKIKLTNAGDVNIDFLELIDLLPKGLRFRSSSIGPAEIKNNDNGTTTIYWDNIQIGLLAPGTSTSIHFLAEIDGSQFGIIQNRVMARGTPPDGFDVTTEDRKNISAYRPALSVAETLVPASGCPETLVDLRIDLTNTGEVGLDAVNLVDLLPRGLRYSSASISPTEIVIDGNGTTSAVWENVLAAPPLAPGASTSIHLFAAIDGTQSGSLQNKIRAVGSTPTGNNVTAEDEKDITICRSSMRVSEMTTPDSDCPGATVDFKIDITNTGDVNLDAIKVVDLLPKGLKYSSASIAPNKKTVHRNKTTSVTWYNILTAPLAPNASTSIHLVSTIDGTQSGSLQNTVTATGTIPTGYDITVRDVKNITAYRSAVQVVSVPTPESGNLGTLIDFETDITNTGDTNIDSVKLVDLLPTGLKYSSASSDPTRKRVNHNKTTSITWSNLLTEPLAPGTTKSIHISATIDGTQSGLLQNKITATGRTPNGFSVIGEDRRNITAYVPAIEVGVTPTPVSGCPGTLMDFEIDLTNTGEVDLDAVKLEDLLPKGLRFSSASIVPSLEKVDPNGTTNLTWNNVLSTSLAPNASTSVHLEAVVDGTQFGSLRNRVVAIGIPPTGFAVTGENLKNVTAYRSAIRVVETPDPSSGGLGTTVDFRIELTNSGEVNINGVRVVNLLPKGLNYSSASIDPDRNLMNANGSRTIIWNNISNSLSPGSSTSFHLKARIDGSVFGGLENEVTAMGKPDIGDSIYGSGSVIVSALAPMLTISKTASKKVVSPEDEITYTILIANTGGLTVKNVVIRDNFDSRIEFISASPMPDSNGVWHISQIEPRSSVIITIKVKVPIESEINFNSDQKIAGDGFVNIANKFSSTHELRYLSNQVSVVAEDFRGYANERVTVSSGPGTELKANEHGSGNYSSEAILQLHSKNRSVEVEKILSARTKPTTFALPGKRLVHFRSKWFDRTSAENRISGTSTEESYRYVDQIEHNSKTKLDRNGTDIAVRADFEGDAHLGFQRKSAVDMGHPSFESIEHYSGRFGISQELSEYGEEVRMNGSANGTGYVEADKHIRQSQRTYESGSGDYRIEELIDTPTSFMAKKIRLSRRPVRGCLPGLNFTGSAGWKEGMWSKTKDTGYIIEGFEDIQHLKKETAVKGLNQMETEANFSGRARFTALSGDNLKLDQENNGDFSIKRSLLLKGVSKFDRPHVSVIKEGQTKTERVNDVNGTVAEYKINVHNDGNTALEPVLIRDLFPPGTMFINSSIKPVKVDSEHANWTLLNLGIGSSITLDLWLKAEPDSDLVNRVNVAGGYGDKWVTASNISIIEKSWLSCCTPEIYLTETARTDPFAKTVAWYKINLKNNANRTMTAVVTDRIPGGMRFLNSSLVPSNRSRNEVKWMVTDLAPGEERFITYRARGFKKWQVHRPGPRGCMHGERPGGRVCGCQRRCGDRADPGKDRNERDGFILRTG